jgi:hypothetical protein
MIEKWRQIRAGCMIGATAIGLQVFAVLFVLTIDAMGLAGAIRYPYTPRSIGFLDKGMLAVLASLLIAVAGLLADKKKGPAIAAIAAIFPEIVLIAMLEGYG